MGMRMRIVAIDVGTKSLGLASYDTVSKHLAFGTHDLTADVPKSKHRDYPLLVRGFLDRTPLVTAADVVLVERQMSPVMKQVAVCFACFLHGKVVMVSPRTVKCQLGTSCGTYVANKKAAVAHVLSEACGVMTAAGRATLRKMKAKARTDCADSVCMIQWYVETKVRDV